MRARFGQVSAAMALEHGHHLPQILLENGCVSCWSPM